VPPLAWQHPSDRSAVLTLTGLPFATWLASMGLLLFGSDGQTGACLVAKSPGSSPTTAHGGTSPLDLRYGAILLLASMAGWLGVLGAQLTRQSAVSLACLSAIDALLLVLALVHLAEFTRSREDVPSLAAAMPLGILGFGTIALARTSSVVTAVWFEHARASYAGPVTLPFGMLEGDSTSIAALALGMVAFPALAAGTTWSQGRVAKAIAILGWTGAGCGLAGLVTWVAAPVVGWPQVWETPLMVTVSGLPFAAWLGCIGASLLGNTGHTLLSPTAGLRSSTATGDSSSRRLSDESTDWLTLIHRLFALVWILATIASLVAWSWALRREPPAGFDLWPTSSALWMAGYASAIAMLVIGAVYGLRTGYGFVRNRWTVVQWALWLAAMVCFWEFGRGIMQTDPMLAHSYFKTTDIARAHFQGLAAVAAELLALAAAAGIGLYLKRSRRATASRP